MVAREVVALDLNTSEVAQARLKDSPNVRFVAGDLLTIGPDELGGTFDIVFSVGVLHHTPDPDRGFQNLLRLVRPGGRLIVWVYSKEGNALVRWLVEPTRKIFLRWLPRSIVFGLAWAIAIPMLATMHTVYRLPFRFLPFYDYLARHRELTVRKTVGDVFDKLNAPHTDFIARSRIERWLATEGLTDVYLSAHLGVSWRGSATRRA
jgi:SAM-dependent methyltransferase